jgi:hypothetical protein
MAADRKEPGFRPYATGETGSDEIKPDHWVTIQKAAPIKGDLSECGELRASRRATPPSGTKVSQSPLLAVVAGRLELVRGDVPDRLEQAASCCTMRGEIPSVCRAR